MKSALLFFVITCMFSGLSNKRPKDVCVSLEEQKLYDLIMEYRKSKNLKTIPLSAALTRVAQTHAIDLATNYTFAQNNSCNLHSWSKEGKWTPCCYTNDHKQAKCMWDKPKEISGYNDRGYEIAYYSSRGFTAQEGFDGWKQSPAHNPLLINDGMWSKVDWNAIGVGLYKEYGVVWFGQLQDDNIPLLCK